MINSTINTSILSVFENCCYLYIYSAVCLTYCFILYLESCFNCIWILVITCPFQVLLVCLVHLYLERCFPSTYLCLFHLYLNASYTYIFIKLHKGNFQCSAINCLTAKIQFCIMTKDDDDDNDGMTFHQNDLKRTCMSPYLRLLLVIFDKKHKGS